MTIVQINSTCGVGSTGKICVGISELLTDAHIENYILYSSRTNGYPLGIPCSEDLYIKAQAFKAKLAGNYGFQSRKATQIMVSELERIHPDIVHLHNIHSHDCHIGMLFDYFKNKHTKLIWTFHDCWAFTGYCPHFTMVKCDKWKIECKRCVQRREYTWIFDRSRELFEKKKEFLQGLDLTIVTPSQWLADLVCQSFLKGYPVKVINNGIDLSVFRPIESSFRKQNGLNNKKIVLGVSFEWGQRKGLDVFVDLAQRLPDDYQIVLVGTEEKTDKFLPAGIFSIHRTQDQNELAAIYSAADVFVNPTREETFPTVNLEAIACGTPVVTFRTGGSSEMLDETCGSVVACDDVDAIEKAIVRTCTQKPFLKTQCVRKARAFEKNERFKEYVELYERVVTSRNQRD